MNLMLWMEFFRGKLFYDIGHGKDLSINQYVLETPKLTNRHTKETY